MMYLIRYGEIFLKGKNRKQFEDRLIYNIRQLFNAKSQKYSITRLRNRLVVESAASVCFKPVFGLVSYSPCEKAKAEAEEIKGFIKKNLAVFKNRSFRISAKRLTKSGLSSEQLNRLLGAYVLENTSAKVSLKKHEVELGIEIINNDAYLFFETIPCFGGLPVGVEGKAALLVEGKASVLAGILMMRRGCEIVPYAFEKKEITALKKYAWGSKPELKLITSLEEIKEQALVTGRTLDTEGISAEIPVLCPLIAFTEEQIKGMCEKYGV